MAGRSSAASERGSVVSRTLERWGFVLCLVALIVWFGVDPATSAAFTSGPNIHQVLANQAVTGVVAVAMVVPLVAGYFDVSVAAVAGLANVAMAAVVGPLGMPIAVGALVAVAVGLVAGCVNGVLVAYLRLNGLIVTLGTFTLVGGLVQWFTRGQIITSGVPESLGEWGSQDWVGIPRPYWVLLAVALVAWYLLAQTPKGRELEAIGSNESAARLVGIRVEGVVFGSFLASGLMAGVGGILLTVLTGSGDPSGGPAYLFPALAAVFLGATAIRPGRYNVWGAVLGVCFVAVAVNGFTLLGADTWVNPVFNGGVLVVAVLISSLARRHRENRAERIALAPSPAAPAPESPREPELTRPGPTDQTRA